LVELKFIKIMLLSIILPIYNIEEYLVECLDSVLSQLRSDYEVILVNDGSTDGSRAIIDQYCLKYPELVIIDKKNEGLSSARNSGMKVARGKYLLFIDGDDLLEPGILEELIGNAESNNADIVVADYYEFEKIEQKRIRYDKSLIDSHLIREEDRLNKLFLIDVSFAVWNKLYRAAFLEKNNLFFLPGYWFEDLDFVFRAFYFANKVVKTDKLLVGYRQRSGSIMKSISLKIMDKMAVMDKIAAFLKTEGKFERYESMYKVLYLKMMFSIVYICMKNGKDESSKEIICRLFDMKYFSTLKNSPFESKHKMKRSVRIFFALIKLGVVNPSSLSFILKISTIIR